jgi:hypothetical protein
MLPDCSQLPEWVCWVAQDSDGSWWAYEHEPNMADAGWYENEVGRTIKLTKGQPVAGWKRQIFKIKRNNQ